MERPPDPPDLLAHAGFLKALARGLLGDEHRAEDVVQDSFAAALAVGERREWRAWLGAVARNLASKVRRGEARREARERRAARPEALPSAADLAAQLEIHRRLVAAVSTLDEPYRSAILLRYFHALDTAEIARREGVPPGTVRARLSRALGILRARLDRERAGWAVVLLPFLDPRTIGVAVMTAGKKTVVLVALALALGSAMLVWRTAGGRHTAPRADTPPAHVGEGSGEPAASRSVVEARPAADDGAPRLRGVVLGPDGRPVAGARVLAYPEDSTRILPLDGDGPGAATDGSGRFAVALAGAARAWTVCATADGYAPSIVEPVLEDDEVTIRLDELASLGGRVLDMEGRPVGGALVRWLGVFRGVSIVRETRSREDGAYVLSVPPPRGAFSASPGMGGAYLEARGPGFAPLLVDADIWQQAVPERLEMDLVLVRGATVRGRVLDLETRLPVAGARVVLWSVEGRPTVGRYLGTARNPFSPRALAEAVADADGAFVFDHVPAHGFHPLLVGFSNGKSACVGASAEGYARGAAEIAAPDDGAEIETGILLSKAAYVHGRVVDARGVPVRGAEVWASGMWATVHWPALYGEPLHVAGTDAQGRYPIRVAGAPGTARIMTAGAHVDVPVREGETVEAPDLVVAERLPREGLDVRVVDGSWAPVGNAFVWTDAVRELADAGGRAVIAARGGATTTVGAQARGFAPLVVGPVTVPAGALAEVRIVLPPAARISGTVVWEDGTPAQGAIVLVLNGRVPLEQAEAGAVYVDRLALTETAQDGSFVAHDLPAGPYHVKAIFHRSALPEKPHAHVSPVATGASGVIVTLPGTYQPPRGVIEGVVRDGATGRAPLSLSVLVGETYARVYSPGRFRAEHLAAGRHTVLVEAPGYASREIEAEVGSGVTTAEIALERGAGVFGRIRNESGLDLLGAAVTLVSEGAPVWKMPESRIGEDGAYRLAAVAPGTYHPVVEWRGGRELAATGYEPIVIEAAGADRQVDFTVVRGGGLKVTVGFAARPAREDLATLRVSLEGEGPRRQWEGTFGQVALPPGRYTLRLHWRDGVAETRTVDVKVDETTEVRLSVP
jgi:RNA polymerase sigma-70 factor (ECF subfamily)